ncbi:hypothetical protein [Maridesulfovibrio sp.]|uniref:hypothetical protein n=1 Tax=Maridesulfovibrio sp. TaxID=2795000 RepID=UPI002A18D0E4|nr:hypothetical protein [Maridesulfovibrio sp.]
MYTFILFLGSLFTFPFSTEPSDLMGVFFLGVGAALIMEALSFLVLVPAYGIAMFTGWLARTGLGGLLVWAAFDMNLAGQGTAIAAAVFYLLIIGFYALTFSKYKRFSVVAIGTGDSLDSFMKEFENAGAKRSEIFKDSDEGRHYELNNFLVNLNVTETDRDGFVYAVGNLIPKNLKCMQKVFAATKGITSIWEGLYFHTNCRVTNGNIKRLFDEQAVFEDAYILGNSLLFTLRTKKVLTGIHGSPAEESAPGAGQVHHVTVSFNRFPQKKEYLLNLNTAEPDILIKINVVESEEGETKRACPELLGGNISFSVVHEGPLDTFGSRLIFKKQGEQGLEYFLISCSSVNGIIIKAVSESEAKSFPAVSVDKYLDYWSSFTPLDANADNEEVTVARPNIFMAPRGKIIILGYDEKTDKYQRVGVYKSERKAVTEALIRAGKFQSEVGCGIYQTYNEDGDLLFATNLNQPVERPNFITKMLRYSAPFWNDFLYEGYGKIILGSYVLALITAIPLFSSFMKEHPGIFLIYMLLPLGLGTTCIMAWGHLSYRTTSRGGRLACVFLGIFGTIIFTGFLGLLVALRVKYL